MSLVLIIFLVKIILADKIFNYFFRAKESDPYHLYTDYETWESV
jgi:hypothetical protein